MNQYVAHPWHGVSLGEEQPYIVNAYIEVTPSDTVKYELDKITGLLKVDRPQLFSNICPTLYGMLPQTYCGKKIGEYCGNKFNRKDIYGDKDPLDICVLTEKLISHGNILVKAIPIGGIKLIDNNSADDKIIAVLKDDALYGTWKNIDQCPESVLSRLQHYFLTYKKSPNSQKNQCEIVDIYGKEEAIKVITLAIDDYSELIKEEHYEEHYI